MFAITEPIMAIAPRKRARGAAGRADSSADDFKTQLPKLCDDVLANLDKTGPGLDPKKVRFFCEEKIRASHYTDEENRGRLRAHVEHIKTRVEELAKLSPHDGSNALSSMKDLDADLKNAVLKPKVDEVVRELCVFKMYDEAQHALRKKMKKLLPEVHKVKRSAYAMDYHGDEAYDAQLKNIISPVVMEFTRELLKDVDDELFPHVIRELAFNENHSHINCEPRKQYVPFLMFLATMYQRLERKGRFFGSHPPQPVSAWIGQAIIMKYD